ncbi:hypothetical protein, partial [Acidisoma sp. S159]|uniref:hypothetical protein n=1 Tax=Acidisoma sp. S159 TaxID=1747225 RepID=UPI001C208181
MGRQVLYRGGFSETSDVARRRAKREWIVGQPRRDHVRRFNQCHADGYVQSCRRNVDHTVAQGQINAKRG